MLMLQLVRRSGSGPCVAQLAACLNRVGRMQSTVVAGSSAIGDNDAAVLYRSASALPSFDPSPPTYTRRHRTTTHTHTCTLVTPPNLTTIRLANAHCTPSVPFMQRRPQHRILVWLLRWPTHSSYAQHQPALQLARLHPGRRRREHARHWHRNKMTAGAMGCVVSCRVMSYVCGGCGGLGGFQCDKRRDCDHHTE